MSKPLYYVQECPTCGRSLQVRVAYLGKFVVCQHCNASFEACDPANLAEAPADSSIDLLRRANELIESVENSRVIPR